MSHTMPSLQKTLTQALLTTSLMTPSTLLQAQSLPTPIASENHTMTTSISHDTIVIPTRYHETARLHVAIDQDRGVLTRHTRKDGRNAHLEGEHFSTVVATDGNLKGFAHITLDLSKQPLPSKARTEAIARDFLAKNAPDLLADMKISWIDVHDEAIVIIENDQQRTVTLSGMKFKAQNLADKRWFWVIVGADEQAMIFERDIVWISMPGHRQTQKWLHDSWLKQENISLNKAS